MKTISLDSYRSSAQPDELIRTETAPAPKVTGRRRIIKPKPSGGATRKLTEFERRSHDFGPDFPECLMQDFDFPMDESETQETSIKHEYADLLKLAHPKDSRIALDLERWQFVNATRFPQHR